MRNQMCSSLLCAAHAVALVALTLGLYGCGSRGEPTAAKKEAVAPQLVKIGVENGVSLDQESIKLAGITVEKVGVKDLAASTEPTGQVAPTDEGTVQITSRLPGKISEVRINVGDLVRKGEVIASVDSV